MTTLKEAADMLARLARDETVDPRVLRSVSAALSARLEALDAPRASLDDLTVTAGDRSPHKPFRVVRTPPADRPACARHLAALERSDVDEPAFEAALSELLSDKSVNVAALRAIAADYAGVPVTSRTTRQEAQRIIRQAFARRQWQHEAYRRIDNLNTAK